MPADSQWGDVMDESLTQTNKVCCQKLYAGWMWYKTMSLIKNCWTLCPEATLYYAMWLARDRHNLILTKNFTVSLLRIWTVRHKVTLEIISRTFYDTTKQPVEKYPKLYDFCIDDSIKSLLKVLPDVFIFSVLRYWQHFNRLVSHKLKKKKYP